jgi:hypothetical protein
MHSIAWLAARPFETYHANAIDYFICFHVLYCVSLCFICCCLCRYEQVRAWALRNASFRRQLSTPDETPQVGNLLRDDDDSDASSSASDEPAYAPTLNVTRSRRASSSSNVSGSDNGSDIDSGSDSDSGSEVDVRPAAPAVSTKKVAAEREPPRKKAAAATASKHEVAAPVAAPAPFVSYGTVLPLDEGASSEDEPHVDATGDDFFLTVDDTAAPALSALPTFAEEDIIDSSDDEFGSRSTWRAGGGSAHKPSVGWNRQQRAETFVGKRYKAAEWSSGVRTSRFDGPSTDAASRTGPSAARHAAPAVAKQPSAPQPPKQKPSHFKFEG